jgi:hypothetical protein
MVLLFLSLGAGRGAGGLLVQLAVQAGIFLALVYLGMVMTETKNQVNSFSQNQFVWVWTPPPPQV